MTQDKVVVGVNRISTGTGLTRVALNNRLARGWSPTKVLTAPMREYPR